MKKRSPSRLRFSQTALILFLAALLCLAACTDNRRALAGSYTAHSDEGSTVTLVLKHDGKGAWSHGGVTETLTWERRGEDGLWLHTKDGGVLRGRLDNDAIILELPSWQTFTFTKR